MRVGRRFSKKQSRVNCELGVFGYGGLIRGCILDEKKAELMIDEWPHSWKPGVITYRLNSYTNDWKSIHGSE